MLAVLTIGLSACHATGPSHVTVRNDSGQRLEHVWLALPERIADAGPLESGAERTIWFWGSRRQGFLLFDAEAGGHAIRGCAGGYLDTDFSHEWSVQFQSSGRFIAEDRGEPYPQHVCATEAAVGKAGWK